MSERYYCMMCNTIKTLETDTPTATEGTPSRTCWKCYHLYMNNDAKASWQWEVDKGEMNIIQDPELETFLQRQSIEAWK